MQFRIGFHGGVTHVVPPPPAVAPAPPPPVAPAPAPEPAVAPAPEANRAPAVRARCEPCAVDTGKSVMLHAEAIDPDHDTVRFRWSVTGGTIRDTGAAFTEWRADAAAGFVIATVVAEDGRGLEASDSVTVEVRELDEVEFEDVHFDFGRSTLRPDVLPILADVIAALKADPGMRLTIEGHTCNIGPSEYNRQLAAARASSIHDYLMRNGIDAARLSTISYGEERPAHDPSQPATRRLNRRAVLLVHLGQE